MQKRTLEVFFIVLIIYVEVVANNSKKIFEFLLFGEFRGRDEMTAQLRLHLVQFMERESEVGPSGDLELHSLKRFEDVFLLEILLETLREIVRSTVLIQS